MKKLLLISIFCCINLTAQVIYVNQSATGLDNGSDWTNAFIDLQDAISLSQTGDEIWVANGIYTPVPIGSYNSLSPERAISFVINDISIYGGFIGDMSETSLQDRPDLDIHNLQTVLSGDINSDDTIVGTDENTAHVIFCSGVFELDSISIQSGYSTYNTQTEGAGMRIEMGLGNIVRCSYINNIAPSKGGGIYITDSTSLIVKESIFINNHSDVGGAVYLGSEHTVFLFCLFSGNTSDLIGSSIHVCDNSKIVNCLFNNNTSFQICSAIALFGNSEIYNSIIINNHAVLGDAIRAYPNSIMKNILVINNTSDTNCAGIYSYSLIMHNSIVRNNTVAGQPSNIARYDGANPTILNSNIEQDTTNAWVFNEPSNFDLEPLFVDVSSSDFHLQTGSPCIDFGRLDDESPRTDYAGNPRVGNPDIGPYEYYTGDPVFTISGSVVGLLDANDVIVRATSGSTQADYYCSSAGRFDFTFYSGEYTLTPIKSGYAFSPSETVVTLSDANVSGIVFTMTEAPIKPKKNEKWYHCAMITEHLSCYLRSHILLVFISLGLIALFRHKMYGE